MTALNPTGQRPERPGTPTEDDSTAIGHRRGAEDDPFPVMMDIDAVPRRPIKRTRILDVSDRSSGEGGVGGTSSEPALDPERLAKAGFVRPMMIPRPSSTPPGRQSSYMASLTRSMERNAQPRDQDAHPGTSIAPRQDPEQEPPRDSFADQDDVR